MKLPESDSVVPGQNQIQLIRLSSLTGASSMIRWVAAAQCTLVLTAQWLLPLDIEQWDLESADAATAEGTEALAVMVLVTLLNLVGKEASIWCNGAYRCCKIPYMNSMWPRPATRFKQLVSLLEDCGNDGKNRNHSLFSV